MQRTRDHVAVPRRTPQAGSLIVFVRHPSHTVTRRTYKLAALFFFILGVTCIIGAVAMFRAEDPDRWFGLAIGVTGLFVHALSAWALLARHES